MKTNEILNYIVKNIEEYMVLKPAFVIHKNYDLILSGYAIERTPNTIYINKFYYPLFDLCEGCHLTYGYRLHGIKNSISIAEVDKSELGKLTTLVIMRDKEKITDIHSLKEFTTLIENRSNQNGFLHPTVQLYYGMTQILLDNTELAQKSFNEAKKFLHHNEISTLEKLENKLNQSPKYAKDFILRQANKMKEKLLLP